MKNNIFRILVNLIAKTWKIEFLGEEPKKTSIIGFWHGKMLPVWFYFKKYNPVAVVSKSKDGQLLSDLLSFWGYKLIRGSSSKDGKEVLAEIIKSLDDNLVLITPDGPRGPKEIFKPGLFVASKKTKKNFYIIDVEMSNPYIFKNAWDNFEFPLPFSKITLKSFGPFLINKEIEKDELNNFITNFKYK
jgi:lysophospholipid acyltransferase (LPLAT)-like uncharacterized protein